MKKKCIDRIEKRESTTNNSAKVFNASQCERIECVSKGTLNEKKEMNELD